MRLSFYKRDLQGDLFKKLSKKIEILSELERKFGKNPQKTPPNIPTPLIRKISKRGRSYLHQIITNLSKLSTQNLKKSLKNRVKMLIKSTNTRKKNLH
jgi:hypothetical protein